MRTEKSRRLKVLLVILGIVIGIFITRSWYERPREESPVPVPEIIKQAEPETRPAEPTRRAQGLILPREGMPRSAGRPLQREVARTAQGLILPKEGMPRSPGRPFQRVEKTDQEIPSSRPAPAKSSDEASRRWPEDDDVRYGGESVVFRMAMLPPKGSPFTNAMEAFAHEVREESGGRVSFRLYPGGQMGDDLDYIMRMKIGTINGACLPGLGLGKIIPQARIMEMPFVFRDLDEAVHVRKGITPMIEKLLEDRGFVVLGWVDEGATYFFSYYPVLEVYDFRRCRCWSRVSDPLAESLFEVLGLTPIPIAEPEVLASLQTGIVDTVYAGPTMLMQQHWFTKIRYVIDLPMNYPISAILLKKRSFDRLWPDLQVLIKQSMGRHLEAFNKMVPNENREGMEALLAMHGLQRIVFDDDGRRAFESIGEEVRRRNLGHLWDEKILDASMSALQEYRLEK